MSVSARAAVIFNASGQPVDRAMCVLNPNAGTSPTYWGFTNSDGYVVWGNVPDTLAATDLWVWRDGYQTYKQSLTLHGGNMTIRVGTSPSQPQDVQLPPLVPSFRKPAVVKRQPLPAFPPGAYVKELPWTPPASRDFLRANAWGITLPGAPMVPGGSSRHPERILSWFLDRFPAPWPQQWLDQNARNGYTHVIQSAADSMGPVDNGPNRPPGAARSLAQVVDFCGFIKRTMPYVTMFLGSKDFQPRDMSAQQWADYADPIMDALIAAKVVDEFVLAWEMDLWNVPGAPTIQALKHAGQKAHAAGCSLWLHFSPEKTSWFADGDKRGRFGFYDDVGADVNGLMYQTKGTAWDAPNLQARLVDTLWQFGTQGHGHKLRMFEDCASEMFDGDLPDETIADQRGLIACCTVDNVRGTDAKVFGFGNGARRPSGDAL